MTFASLESSAVAERIHAPRSSVACLRPVIDLTVRMSDGDAGMPHLHWYMDMFPRVQGRDAVSRSSLLHSRSGLPDQLGGTLPSRIEQGGPRRSCSGGKVKPFMAAPHSVRSLNNLDSLTSTGLASSSSSRAVREKNEIRTVMKALIQRH